MVEVQPDQKLSTDPRVLVHDFLELIGIGEDHGGVFTEIISKIGLPICIHKALLIVLDVSLSSNFNISPQGFPAIIDITKIFKVRGI